VAANVNLARLRQWADSVNRGTPAFAETFAPDATFDIVGFSQVRDREGFTSFFGAVLTAFPDVQFTLDELLPAGEGGDATVTRWTARGTHRGDLLGIPATGKSVTFQGMLVDRWRDGKIVERRELADMLGMMQQLGVVPAPGQSG
jgi:steroid delta-isomerase-like uncharacterized protein